MTRAAIEVVDLTKRFGPRVATDQLRFDVPGGSISGLIGANGSGKTTTLRMLTGLVRPTAGSATVLGQPIAHPAAYLRRVGALIEQPAFVDGLSGRRNLEIHARLGRLSKPPIDDLVDLVDLTDRADDPYRTYSLGMKQRLGIAAALLVEPALVILDEPTNGLDPQGIADTRHLLRDLADRGATVFVSSHQLNEIDLICDHLVILHKGQVIHNGPPAQLSQHANTAVQAADPGHTDILYEALHDAGFTATRTGVHIEVDTADSAQIGRIAHNAEVPLAALTLRRPTLEQIFLNLDKASRT